MVTVAWWVGLGCTHFFMLIFGMGWGALREQKGQIKKWQSICVKRGMAHWVTDDEGQSEFRWWRVKDITYCTDVNEEEKQ